MNILICSFSFPAPAVRHFGGKFVFSEAMAYAENGATVRVLTPWIPGTAKKEKVHDGMTVYRFRYFFPSILQRLVKPNKPLYEQKSLLSNLQIPCIIFMFFLHIIRQMFWADIVHSQWTVTALLTLLPKWIFKKKVILTARGSDIRLLPHWLNQLIHSHVDAAVDCFGPQPWNEAYKKKFSANFIKLPLVVFNDSLGSFPEDVRKNIDMEIDPLLVFYIGRFERIKVRVSNLPLLNLISASQILLEQKRNFHIFYIGDGVECHTIQKKIIESQVGDFVTILGPKNNIFDYLNICHLGVGGVAFNGVSGEYTVAGIPQILVKCGVNDNTPWEHMRNAIFVEGCNASDIAVKIGWAIDNRDSLKKIGKNAQQDMKELVTDSKRGGQLYLKEFRKLLDKGVEERM